MAYSLELYFTGLCAFVPDENKSKCTVLLVNASDPGYFPEILQGPDKPNQHRPLLVVPSLALDRDSPRKPDFLTPDSEGNTLACFYIEEENLLLKAGLPNLQFKRGLGSDSFDRVIPLEKLFAPGVTELRDDSLNPRQFDSVISRFTFDHGELRNHKLAMREGRVLEFDFLPFDSLAGTSALTRQAISDVAVLGVPGLTQRVTIASSKLEKGDIVLYSEKSGVVFKAYFTNYDQVVTCPRRRVVDFLWYHRLAKRGNNRNVPSPGEQLIPVDSGLQSPTYAPQSCSCPPCTIDLEGFIAPGASATTSSLAIAPALETAAGRLGISRRSFEILVREYGPADLKEKLETTISIFRGKPANGRYLECVALGPKGSILVGSGIAIGPRHILTASHLIDRDVIYTIDTDAEPVEAKLHGRHDYADLAILKSSADIPGAVTAVFGSVAVNDEVVIVGFGGIDPDPTAGGKSFGKMIVTSLDIGSTHPHDPLLSLHEMRAEPSPQSACPLDSGGPVFKESANGNRQLVAIIRGPIDSSILCEGDAALIRLGPFLGWVNDMLAL